MDTDKIFCFVDKILVILNPKKFSPPKEFKLPGRALLIFPDFIGDAIILTPFLRNLRKNLGSCAVIDVVCPKCVAEMLITLPYVNRYYPKDYAYKNKDDLLKNGRYDTIFILQPAMSWLLKVSKKNIPQRVTPNLERLGVNDSAFLPGLATHLTPSYSIKSQISQIEINLNMLRYLGLQVKDCYPEIKLKNQDIERAKSLINDKYAKNALIHVTAVSNGKQWQIEKWIEVVKHLDKKGYKIYVTGKDEDKKIYDSISEKAQVEIINLCGKTSIRETFGIHKFMQLVITTDSAPAHIAGLAEVPEIIVIYGPTNNFQWKPYATKSNLQQIYLELDCRPCILRTCHNQKCLTGITSDLVIAAIDRVKSGAPVFVEI